MKNIDSNELIKLNRDYSELRPIVEKIQEYKNLQIIFFIYKNIYLKIKFHITGIINTI